MNSDSQQTEVEREIWVHVVYTPLCLPFGVGDDVCRVLKDFSEATSSVLEPAGLFLLPVHLI